MMVIFMIVVVIIVAILKMVEQLELKLFKTMKPPPGYKQFKLGWENLEKVNPNLVVIVYKANAEVETVTEQVQTAMN